MYYKINNNNVKVSVTNNITVPTSLEFDMDKIATEFGATSIKQINIVSDNDGFMGMSVGRYINNKKHSTILLTPKLLNLSKTCPELYYEYLAHEIQHSLNFEIFSSYIDYDRYLYIKNHIKTNDDLFFCYGITFLDEYLAYLKGREYSPAMTNLFAEDVNGNDIYYYSFETLKMAMNILKTPSNGRNIFHQYQKKFEILIIDIIQLLTHKSEPTLDIAKEIESKLKKDRLIEVYMNKVETYLKSICTEYPNNLSNKLFVSFGKTLFSIFEIIGIEISDEDNRFNFIVTN